MSYRVENSKTRTAGCQNKPCKDEGIKIQKGELRFGIYVTIDTHGSWRWKHWGCVTGAQMLNVRKYLKQGDDDGPYQWDFFDGLDELEEKDQEKVKKAVIEGKIADEDWIWDPEYNQLGQKGTGPRNWKELREAKENAGSEEDTKTEEKKPAKKRGRAKKDKNESDDEDTKDVKPAAKRAKKEVKSEVKAEDDDAPMPAKKRGRAKKEVVKNEPISDNEMAGDVKSEAEVEEEKPRKARGRAKKEPAAEKIKTDPYDAENITDEKAAPAKKGRGPPRKADTDETQAPAKKTRGRAKKAKEVTPETASEAATTPESASAADVTPSASPTASPSPEPEPTTKRGRAAKNSKAKAAPAATTTRARRGAPNKGYAEPGSDVDDDEEAREVEKPKQKRKYTRRAAPVTPEAVKEDGDEGEEKQLGRDSLVMGGDDPDEE